MVLKRLATLFQLEPNVLVKDVTDRASFKEWLKFLSVVYNSHRKSGTTTVLA